MNTDAHEFRMTTIWKGNKGQGTKSYGAYSRNFELGGPEKAAPLKCSSDPIFRGDGSRYNPEELLVGSLSSCHMLWLLHLAADAGIIISEYVDHASGTMVENEDGSGQFTSVILRPHMKITDPARIADAKALHEKAHALCFVARSVNFPVTHEVTVEA